MVGAGIADIMIVVGGPHAGHFLRVLRNGKGLGIKSLSFAYQEKEGGIADALSLAEDYADNDSTTVILGDNCTDADISEDVKSFSKGAKIFLKKVVDPHRFGVPTFDLAGNIIDITEKPKKPRSSYAVTGLYIYDNTVFRRIKTLKPSERGELEVTDLNRTYLKDGELSWTELKVYWRDAGTFDTLFEVNSYWAEKKNTKV